MSTSSHPVSAGLGSSSKPVPKTTHTEVIEESENEEELQQITCSELRDMERTLVRKIDLRLCTIAGLLCSLNLLGRSDSYADCVFLVLILREQVLMGVVKLDSGIISSASVTT